MLSAFFYASCKTIGVGIDSYVRDDTGVLARRGGGDVVAAADVNVDIVAHAPAETQLDAVFGFGCEPLITHNIHIKPVQ